MIKYFLFIALARVVAGDTGALSAPTALIQTSPTTADLDQVNQSEADDKRMIRVADVNKEAAGEDRFMLEFGALVQNGFARLISALKKIWGRGQSAMDKEEYAKVMKYLRRWIPGRKKTFRDRVRPVMEEVRVKNLFQAKVATAKRLIKDGKSYEEQLKEGIDYDHYFAAQKEHLGVDPFHQGTLYYAADTKAHEYKNFLEKEKRKLDLK